MERAFKRHTVTAVEPVFLYPLVDHITGLVQISSLTMIQRLFSTYGVIDKIDLE